VKRRQAILVAMAAAFAPSCAFAQEKLRRVGWLTGGSPKSHAKLLEAFRAGMKEHGWIEGKNLALELRWAEGRIDRVPALAQELVRLNVEAIVTAATPVIAAVKKTTSTIPIVMATGSDPVGAGLVSSLARPGGNVTGLSGFFEATPIKMLELAGALVPRGARVVVLVETKTLFAQDAYRRSAEESARAAGMRPEFVSVTSVEDVSRAFAALAGERPGAVVVMPGPTLFFLARDTPAHAAALKVPVIYPFEESADAGGLMSYAAPLADSYRRAARYVDLILRGTKPGELPIEQPTRLSLVINLRTAKAQGIRIPRDVVLRADRVIE
jgi:putative ABC transport system substrate-binding protein